jgi:type I restriction enzyme S subunit
MIVDLEPYPAMKDSGVPWLGEVPEHWGVLRLRSVLTGVTERNRTDLPLLSVVREKGVILRDVTSKDENHNFIPDDLTNYKVVRKGQFAMNKMKAWQGSYGISQYDGIISPAYFVFDVDAVGGDFFHSAIRSKAYVPFFTQASDGVRIGQWDLSQSRMREIPFFVPPLSEQAAIVRYLDHVDRRIRRFIRTKQKLIKLLEEQKQAIIHQAVTRGLDPNVPLKPSGIEWLGDVPEHWEVRQLRYLIEGKLTYGANEAAEHANPSWPRYLRITDFGLDGTLRSDTFRSLPPEIAKDYLVQPGDILLARSGATVGKAFLVTSDAGQACHAGYLIRARPRRSLIEPRYLFAFIRSTGFMRWKDSTFIIATIQNISAEKYADMFVPSPPLAEQSQIIRYLDKATTDIDIFITRANREIELLREYRTRLIADVVTGKLDVREAAASLPDESDDFEQETDLEDLIEAVADHEVDEDHHDQEYDDE